MSKENPNDDHLEEDFEAMLADALGKSPTDEAHDRALTAAEAPLQEDVPEGFQSGFVAVVGQPNVGKSTIINHILGEKIAIVSPKPQTTRIRQLGILNRDNAQVIFVDTPGIHQPEDDLGEFMVQVAKSALEDADVVLFVVDGSHLPNRQDRNIIGLLQDMSDPEKIILVLNKMDQAKDPDRFKQIFEIYEGLLPESQIISTIAIKGDGVVPLVEAILGKLPEGPRYYPADQLSDLPLRNIAAEMIREQVLRNTHQEVPHSIAVEVDEFKKRQNDMVYIHANVYVERSGQKGIIIGKKGSMLKKIASYAREDIERFLGNQVYLDIQVKVLPNWRKDENALQRLGYRL